MLKPVWGIDLGTTYSCIARVDEHGYTVVLNNPAGDPVTPSVVFFESPDKAVAGQPAKDELQMSPDLVCDLVKQQMGTADWRFTAHGHEWSAPEVSALILREVADGARLATGLEVEDVVITVPAYFGVTEREATIAAGKLAGLNVLDVLNEPTAAAFSYGFARGDVDAETVLVYDLGGGTFDVTVIHLGNVDGNRQIEVLATGGDDALGGALWDQRLVGVIAAKFVAENPDMSDPLDDAQGMADLKLKSESIKRALTTKEDVTEIVLSGTDRARVTVTRAEFESATQDLLERTVDYTKDALAVAAGKGSSTIDRVLLVGGSSFMPQVRERLVREWPSWNPELADPNQSVAKGAALAAMQEALRQIIVEGSAAGASVDATPEQVQEIAEAAGLSRAATEQLLKTEFTNVASRGFGIRVLRETTDPSDPRPWREHPEDFCVVPAIEAQTRLPVTGREPDRVQTYFTTVDGQRSVQLTIMEQDSREFSEDMASNKFLEEGLFELSRAYDRGAPIEVSLGMDASGRLDLFARDADGKETHFTAQSEGAVWSDEKLAEAQTRVDSVELRR